MGRKPVRRLPVRRLACNVCQCGAFRFRQILMMRRFVRRLFWFRSFSLSVVVVAAVVAPLLPRQKWQSLLRRYSGCRLAAVGQRYWGGARATLSVPPFARAKDGRRTLVGGASFRVLQTARGETRVPENQKFPKIFESFDKSFIIAT